MTSTGWRSQKRLTRLKYAFLVFGLIELGIMLKLVACDGPDESRLSSRKSEMYYDDEAVGYTRPKEEDKLSEREKIILRTEEENSRYYGDQPQDDIIP